MRRGLPRSCHKTERLNNGPNSNRKGALIKKPTVCPYGLVKVAHRKAKVGGKAKLKPEEAAAAEGEAAPATTEGETK